MYNSRKVVLYDLDSTLFNVQHREHLAPEGEARKLTSSWIAYSQGCVDDTAVEGVATSARMFAAAGYRIHIVSGRNVEALEQTIEVMDKYRIPFNEIRLHRDEDLRHNGEYKSQYINELKESGFEPVLMFEDHISVCEMIEERTGVPCITVNPRYDDGVGVSFNLNQYPELVAK